MGITRAVCHRWRALVQPRTRGEVGIGQTDGVSLLAAERFFAFLALIAGTGAVLIAFARLLPAGRRVTGELQVASLWLAWLVAATCTVGSLYFSESLGLLPCTLCWYQRVAMYPMAVILLVAALRRDRSVRWYAVPLAGIGISVSVYHYLIEWNPEWEATSCDITVPCTTPYFRAFGFVSISFMALCGFAAILALLLLVPAPTGSDSSDDEADGELTDTPTDLLAQG